MQSKASCILLAILCVCAAAFGAEAQAGDEGLSPFSGSFADAVWTVIAFVVLLVVLWKLAWKPILAALNARQEHIEKQISDAEETRKEAGQVLAEYKAKLENAENEGKQIITTHVKRAQQEAKEVIAKAEEKMEAMKLKLEADIERARNEAKAELFNDAGEMVLRLGQEILGRTINNEDNQKLISEAVEQLKREELKGG